MAKKPSSPKTSIIKKRRTQEVAPKTAASDNGATKAVTRTTTAKRRSATERPASAPTHEAIAQRAYELFLRDGMPQGRDLEHWLQAERELAGQGPGNG